VTGSDSLGGTSRDRRRYRSSAGSDDMANDNTTHNTDYAKVAM